MGIDIRLPIGLLFALLGTLLAVYGSVSDSSVYARSLGYNINLWWGLTLLAFGLVLLYLVRRRRTRGQLEPPASSRAPHQSSRAK